MNNLFLGYANEDELLERIALGSRRYIGNKTKLVDFIINSILKSCNTFNSFADLFAGTGSVSMEASKYFKEVIINDILYSNNVIYRAFFKKGNVDLSKIKYLISYYNSIDRDKLDDNYFSTNFGNKYFDYENAKLIGYIREDIERRKKTLTVKSYNILIASLIYSMDKIANTIGHYDAYIQKPIKQKKLEMKLIQYTDLPSVKIYRKDSNELVRHIKTDVAYIDPPYNSRQYSRFYHLYETLVKWDKPKLYGVAMKPPTENMSYYCNKEAKTLFEDLIKNLDAKYIVVSYNNTYESKSSSSRNTIKLEDIKRILMERGETKTIERPYRFFNAGHTNFKDHKEILFITRVNYDNMKTLRSPIFYIGDKYRLIPQLRTYFPTTINKFIEPFAGGGTVSLNIKANEYYLNDINKYVYILQNFLLESAKNKINFFESINFLIDKYGLSASYKEDIIPAELKQNFKKTYYAKYNKNAYEKLRYDFNQKADTGTLDEEAKLMLYILVIYGFNRLIRLNSKNQFNVPVGNLDFNKNTVKTLNQYFNWTKNKVIKWYNLDYREFLTSIKIADKDFVYIDPPYLITSAEYNKLWNEENEYDLINLLDNLNKKNIRFAVSNIIEYKNKKNYIFDDWSRNYNTYAIKSNYISYHNNSIKQLKEVLVTNYEHKQKL